MSSNHVMTRREKFEALFTVTPGCWNWQGWRNRQAYGEFIGFGERLAHRVAYVLYVGPIPEGLCILHSCDNPSCVNPAHLSPGTRTKNLADMTRRGRRARGAKHGMAKLNESQVLQILKDPRRSSDVALEYGVSRRSISLIRAGINWSHLTQGK